MIVENDRILNTTDSVTVNTLWQGYHEHFLETSHLPCKSCSFHILWTLLSHYGDCEIHLRLTCDRDGDFLLSIDIRKYILCSE